MGVLEMKRQDLQELYQLLSLYERTYGEEIKLRGSGFREELQKKYKELTGRDIRRERNPRKAGRKKTYTEEENKLVVELYEEGESLRQISRKIGCSTGHVQDVLKERKIGRVYGN